MTDHRKRLAWLFIGYGGGGMLLLVVAALVGGPEAGLAGLLAWPLALAHGLVALAGWLFLKDLRGAKPAAFVAAVILLTSAPLGTVIAIYYFWYLLFSR
ncbi:MAG: hypothetical protein LJE84_13530 [Gammaproteobacteria bacterium]|nr:hypothetical protein [Gammaproteobacteria bacterium]